MQFLLQVGVRGSGTALSLLCLLSRSFCSDPKLGNLQRWYLVILSVSSQITFCLPISEYMQLQCVTLLAAHIWGVVFTSSDTWIAGIDWHLMSLSCYILLLNTWASVTPCVHSPGPNLSYCCWVVMGVVP